MYMYVDIVLYDIRHSPVHISLGIAFHSAFTEGKRI